jgi:hypothetical protein
MPNRREVAAALMGLSDKDIEKVRDFIDSLKTRSPEPCAGSAEAVSRAVGAWWMTPEETRQFLRDIEVMRHREDAERALPSEC